MAKTYTKVKQYENEVIKLKEQGLTHREISERFNLSREQIKEMLKRKRRREIKISSVPKKKGRPRQKPTTTFKELEKENKRLMMENELLRDFLSETERK